MDITIWFTLIYVRLIVNTMGQETFVNAFFNSLGVAEFSSYYCDSQDAFVGAAEKIKNEAFLSSNKNLIALQNKTMSFEIIYKRSIFIDLSCQEGQQFLMQYSDEGLLRNTKPCLLWVSRDQDMEPVKDLLASTALGIDNNMVLVIGSGISSDGDKQLFRVKKYHPTSRQIFLERLYGLQDPNIVPRTLVDFNGQTINIILVLLSSEFNLTDLYGSIVDESFKPGVDTTNRLSLVHHQLLARYFNFSINCTVVNQWGYKEPDGSYSGMTGLLKNKVHDFGISYTQYTLERHVVIDYQPAAISWDLYYIFRQKASFGGPTAVLKPFHYTVWLAVIFLLVIAAIMFTIGSGLVVRESEEVTDPDLYYTREEKYNYSSGFLLLFGIMSQQGIDEESQKTSLRILSLACIVFSFLVFTLYSSEILNGLLSKSPNTIKNFDDLINSNLLLALWNTPYIKANFYRNDSVAKRLIRKGEKQPGGLPLVDVKRGVEMVQTAKYALFTSPQSTYVTIFETFTNGEICTLYSLTKPDYSLIAAPAMSKNSSMKQVGYYGNSWIKEVGLEDKVYNDWLPPLPPCLPEQEYTSVAVESLMVAYIILTIGLLLSPIVLLIELHVIKRKQKKRKTFIRNINVK